MSTIKKLYSLIYDIIKRFTKNNISVFAAQATFFILVSAVPFIMLLLGIITRFFPFAEIDFLNAVTEFMPDSLYHPIKYIINETFSKTTSSFISITAITALWSASRGVLSIIKGLNSVYEVSDYSYFKGQLIALLYTFLFILALSLSPVVLIFEEFILKTTAINIHYIVVFLLLITLFSIFYAYLPKRKSRFISQLPGSIFTAISWILFSFCYNFYINNFSNFPKIYGSLGAVVLFMLWLYFCVNIFLIGALLNRSLSEKNYIKK